MKTLTLQRLDNATYGLLQDEGIVICHTLEWGWKDNEPDDSRFPAGTYPIYLRKSHLNGGDGKRAFDVWELSGVPGRQAIEIHIGNTHADTEGCVLLGMAVSVDATPEVPRIADSRTAFGKWMALMQPYESEGAVLVVADPL